MLIKYRIIKIINKDDKEEYRSKIEVENDLLFEDLISIIVLKYDKKTKLELVHCENLIGKTWQKIFSRKFINRYMKNVVPWGYSWLNYKIEDIQKSFKLFDEELDIIISSGGWGGTFGEIEGIKIKVNPNENDRHKNIPHIHAIYQSEMIRIRIKDFVVMKNETFKNPSKTKAAIEFVKKNQIKLMNYWSKMNNSDFCIEPEIEI